VKPPDWTAGFDLIPEGHVFKLKKAIYGTKQAARRWRSKILEWMENNGYDIHETSRSISSSMDFLSMTSRQRQPRRLSCMISSRNTRRASKSRGTYSWSGSLAYR
jgi:hypothetical protein